MDVVLKPRRGKPRIGDFVMRLASGGVGHNSIDEVKAALGSIGAGGVVSTPPTGAFEVTDIYVQDGKLVVEYNDVAAS